MDETQRILEMLEQGKITADEANKLIEAVEATPTGQAPTVVSPSTGEVAHSANTRMQRLRRLTYIAFAVALALLALVGWGTVAVTQQLSGRVTLGLVALWIVLGLSLLLTALTFWMTQAPWLHVHIEDKQEKTIAFSLPLPLMLAGWGVRIAHHFVKQDIQAHLDTAAELIWAMRGNLRKRGAEPMTVEVNEEGQRVQLYIG